MCLPDICEYTQNYTQTQDHKRKDFLSNKLICRHLCFKKKPGLAKPVCITTIHKKSVEKVLEFILYFYLDKYVHI